MRETFPKFLIHHTVFALIKYYNTRHKSLKQTETVSVEFSRKFLIFTLHTFVLTQIAPLLPNVEPRVFWSTETTVIPKSTLGKGKRTHVS